MEKNEQPTANPRTGSGRGKKQAEELMKSSAGQQASAGQDQGQGTPTPNIDPESVDGSKESSRAAILDGRNNPIMTTDGSTSTETSGGSPSTAAQDNSTAAAVALHQATLPIFPSYAVTIELNNLAGSVSKTIYGTQAEPGLQAAGSTEALSSAQDAAAPNGSASSTRKSTPGLAVTSSQGGFRRAGRAWATTETVIAMAELKPGQLEQLRTEPMLTVVDVEIEAEMEGA